MLYLVDVGFGGTSDLVDGIQRQSIKTVIDSKEQGAQNGERQGRRRRKVVPRPTMVSIWTLPLRRVSTLWTTSSPMPRPESSVISSAVEKPGRKSAPGFRLR